MPNSSHENKSTTTTDVYEPTTDKGLLLQGECYGVSSNLVECLFIVSEAYAHTKGVRTGVRKHVGSAVAVWLCRDVPYRDRRRQHGKSVSATDKVQS
jgi:hypothetical protein